MKRQPAPDVCPICGEDVPPNALACPECGADYNSGWREDADATDALGGTGDDFDYNEFVQEEFGTAAKPRGVATLWWISAVVLLVALALMWLYAAG